MSELLYAKQKTKKGMMRTYTAACVRNTVPQFTLLEHTEGHLITLKACKIEN